VFHYIIRFLKIISNMWAGPVGEEEYVECCGGNSLGKNAWNTCLQKEKCILK
jgi:hypothetical protein